MQTITSAKISEYAETVARPGKFELEHIATPYFYDVMLNGDGEAFFHPFPIDPDADDADYESEPCVDVFTIDADEADAFNLPVGSWYGIYEDSQGFVIGKHADSRDALDALWLAYFGVEA